ncbi:unnamed protein product [Cuscuta campestris]|uniref:Reverse transcriptase domain-containing protein n=1 Tax=Cuscuta campestris TaxID=132261 RepID=A0A484KDK0_9ASTE|nr:unnamed protein product [Cuscuta campestris]
MIPSHEWIVGGDFNAVANLSEHSGRISPLQSDMDDLNDCLENCGLINPRLIGNLFTWSGNRSRGRVQRRLDRAVVNGTLMNNYDDITVTHLSSTTSDHKPILLQCLQNQSYGPKPFRFQNMWMNHNNFLQVISDFWKSRSYLGGIHGLDSKLKGLKAVLKEWNLKSFGNIQEKIQDAERLATSAQECFEADQSDFNRANYNKAKAELIMAIDNEFNFWKQKANLKWIEEGDSNTKFFHAYVKGRRTKSMIRVIEDSNGKPITNIEVIKKMAIEHFFNQFNNRKSVSMSPILAYINPTITEEDNNLLTMIPSDEEIKNTVWSLSPDSAPGPDGYNGHFFKFCWEIIHKDVISATREFFLGVPVRISYGSTFISLIPKINDPKNFCDYRPISLSTFMSKINTKILATRLQKILHKVVSVEQTGFQTLKGVKEQILLIEEMVHRIDNNTRSGNLVIKLDMAKAFDNMEWEYISNMLRQMGFSAFVTTLLLANLEASQLSILINGSPCGFFKMMRGVKQGDPLSPLLFILASEGLSRMLKKTMESGYISPFNTGRNILISHLAFADDIIIFSKGDGC